MSVESLLILLGLPALALILHAIGSRLALFQNLALQLTTGIYCAIGLVVVVSMIFFREGTSAGLFAIVIGVQLAHLYFQLFNLSETARRIKILTSLKGTSQPLSKHQGYSPESMLKIRLDRLVELGSVGFKNGIYHRKLGILTIIGLVFRAHERLLFPQRLLR